MARIRTVKPEFWSSEQVMSCRPLARLLFIGLWNFCDDGGNHPLAPRTIKALVFPGDDITADEVSGLLGELEGAGLIQSYWVDGKNYFHVRGWKHQKIEKKNFKYPGPPSEFDDQSANDIQPVVEESSTGSRPLDPVREGKGIGEDQHNTQRAGEENSADPKSPTEMTLDWVPDERLLKAYATRMAIPIDAFTSEATAAFVCHYSASGRFETQASWVSLLVKWVKRDRASESNVHPFPQRRTPSEPDFDSTEWARDLVVSP
ncbi:DnaT-like ssDNA-binding domain-containing protein [Pseudomonas sp. R16(2017)]|uniref:DnaT-like ssDNA-binding domain-containing protein n=1 Tax=Pseudomonas sp. R16(2017) TaxID=1981704 RepID=UPI000A1E0CCC|nr:DnaT-like ssDNA-binding domain-containing protein [Pseudomonas sp. R16(2017)]